MGEERELYKLIYVLVRKKSQYTFVSSHVEILCPTQYPMYIMSHIIYIFTYLNLYNLSVYLYTPKLKDININKN